MESGSHSSRRPTILLHQSDLAAWSRCSAEYGYKLAGLPTKTNSAAAFGTVVHYALLSVFERLIAAGIPAAEAQQKALETFLFYWHPSNISAITEPVPNDGWLPKQGFNELRERGVETIRSYAEMVKTDDGELLATEYSFVVPIDGTWDEDLGEPHLLGGTVDKLVARYYRRALYVDVADLKTGKEYKALRQNVQGTSYAYATTKPEFWLGNKGEEGFGAERGQELYERFHNKARRFTWVNLRSFKSQDGGWRGPHDYHRLAVAAEQLVAAIKAEIFPLSISGDACTYCDFRAMCAGVGVPDADHGKPAAA